MAGDVTDVRTFHRDCDRHAVLPVLTRRLALLALLLLPAAPAVAQQPHDVWTATLTVDVSSSGIHYGCSERTGIAGLDDCSAALTSRAFVWQGNTYGIDQLLNYRGGANNALTMTFDRHVPSRARDFFLVLGNTKLAGVNAGRVGNNVWTWTNTGLAWADNDTVEVKLHWEGPQGPRPGKPALTLVTSGTNAPTATTLSFTIPCVTPGKAHVTDYVVRAEKSDGSAVTQFFSVPSPCSTITATLTDLTEATQYLVRAFARNLFARQSEWSDYVQGDTLAMSIQGGGSSDPKSKDPLTASFEQVPSEHEGKGTFSFLVRLSETVGNFSKSPRASSFEVTQGRVRSVEQVDAGLWRVRVVPSSRRTVGVTLTGGRDCDAEGAVCTPDGRPLSNTVSATVRGPAGPYAALIAKMYEWRNDSCCVHNKAHTDRWDRALLAFGETVADSSLTPMGAAEAQGYADRGWTRWVEVAAALWEIEGGSPDPVVTVAAGDAVTEGASAGFTLTAAPAPAADLAVRVAVSQRGDVAVASVLGERTVTIAAGTASADFTVATVDDDADEADGGIVATVGAGGGYTVGDAARAMVTVADNDEDNPGIVTKRGIAREGTDDAVVFTVRLDRPASHTATVDYATADGAGVWAGTAPAMAGVDYTPTSGTLSFAAGETSKSVSVPILDDVIDEGSEYFLLRFSNPQGATLEASRREVQGIIRNTDLIPSALLGRFGRATAEQVVQHIEERMAAPRQRGFRARFAGREVQPGSERDFALGFLSQFAGPMGAGRAGAAPMGGAAMGAAPMAMGSQAAGAGALGAGMGGTAGAMGMAGGQPPMDGAQGVGLFSSMLGGGDLFSNSEFELNRESRGGILSVWSRSSRSSFSGLEDKLSLNGDARTTMFGADYSRGALTLGLSVGRTFGLGGYRGKSGGQMTTSMTGFYPWVGYQVSDRVSVWGVTGYGTGALSLTPDGQSALETGVSMAMSAVGTRGELIGSRATGGFGLAFKADALWVGAGSELLDGPTGRLNASEAGVTRVRTALEGSRGFTLVGGRLSLRPSVEVGLRRDAGDAETGAGMDVGGGLAFTDKVTGLSLDVRVRTLVVHQADGFTERGMSLSLGWDPTPSSPLGLTARVAPSWGGSAQGGAEALWSNQMAYGMGSHQMYGSGDRVDAEVGYGLPVGARFVGTPRVGLAASQYGRDYRVGYGLGVLDRGDVNFELGVDAQRRQSPTQGGTSNGVMGRASLGW